jgi:BclB C-terminal domain-containing protein
VNLAFSVPRNGAITSIAAFFSTTVGVLLDPTVTATIQAQVWRSTSTSNFFTPIPGAVVTLAPALTGLVAIGTISSGTSTVNIPVTAGERLILVFSVTSPAGLASVVTGVASAGIGIS